MSHRVRISSISPSILPSILPSSLDINVLANDYEFYIFKEKKSNEDQVVLYNCGKINNITSYTNKISWNYNDNKFPYTDCDTIETAIDASDIIGFVNAEYKGEIKYWNAQDYLTKSQANGQLVSPGHIYGIKKPKKGGHPRRRGTFRQRRFKRTTSKSRRRATRRTHRRV